MTPAGSGPEVASGNVGHNCRQQLPSVAAVAASSSAQLLQQPPVLCAVTTATGGQVELLNHHLVQVSEIKSYYWTADTYYIVELFNFDINDTMTNNLSSWCLHEF